MKKSAKPSKSIPVVRKRKTSPGVEPTRPRAPGPTSFPIVGIGSSAGGLEALDQFLHSTPTDSGMAFVIVQHLDPTHKGIMVELLQRATAMPVVQVRDRLRVEPNRVYVIPPNKDMSILHGVLHLLAPVSPRGLRLPIDFFFRSLAEDQQDHCVGVILSGMGSDGTLGLRAIKEKAGVVFVQSPESAKFDGMPHSAIAAGLSDGNAPAGELPAKIIAYLQHAPLLQKRDVVLDDKAQGALEKIAILLRMRTGHDFSQYKKNTIYRRIERRMGLHQIAKIGDYVRYLQANSAEGDLLFKELLIGVTRFFRDPAAWAQLASEAIPALLEAHPNGGVLRAWVPGCSTGEEAYSLAIAFREAVERAKPERNVSLLIFATDLDKDAVNQARQGVFPANIAADMSEERLRRFFVHDERGYRVSKEIRESIIFAPQNLVMDPPFTKLDIISCRNLLIYLSPELQKKLLPLFHYSLAPGGMLMLGSAEAIGNRNDLFAPLAGNNRIFRRVSGVVPQPLAEFPSAIADRYPDGAAPAATRAAKPAQSLQALADHAILQRFAPAAVLTTAKGDILYISGKTGKYLEPAAGKANWNILAMARSGLHYPLGEALSKAVRQQARVVLPGVKVGDSGGTQFVDITIQPMTEPDDLHGMVLFVFAEVAPPPEVAAPSKPAKHGASGPALRQMEQELRRTREDLQTVREEMQTSQEELKSSNEELQSTNEELQSTNEELTTSKEEMQSMNEELQTVNHELQGKVDELSWASSDMKNLLNSTDIATLFLDEALRIRRFTTHAAKIIKLIPGDVGRPLTDLASTLIYPALADEAREVLASLVFKEKPVSDSKGNWFLVRVMPYRTHENKIDGLVITFTDITAARKLDTSLREASQRTEAILHAISDACFSLDDELAITYLNPAAEELLGHPAGSVLGKTLLAALPKELSSMVDEKCRLAMKDKAALTFETQMDNATCRGWYNVRVYPHASGVTVLFQSRPGRQPVGPQASATGA